MPQLDKFAMNQNVLFTLLTFVVLYFLISFIIIPSLLKRAMFRDIFVKTLNKDLMETQKRNNPLIANNIFLRLIHNIKNILLMF